jgi:kynurenine formamidase
MHQIPSDRFIGQGVVIDVSGKAASNPDYELAIQDMLDWESEHGHIPDHAIVLMNSGWSPKFPNQSLVFGTDDISNVSTFHFLGIHPDTASWRVRERDVNIVGLDTSVDCGCKTTGDSPTHRTFASHNIPMLENVANRHDVSSAGTTIFVGVIKLEDGSGAPARVLAQTTATPSSSSAMLCSTASSTGVVAIVAIIKTLYNCI